MVTNLERDIVGWTPFGYAVSQLYISSSSVDDRSSLGCSDCPERFDNYEGLTEHLATDHVEYEPYGCLFCTARRYSRQKLAKHIVAKRHGNATNFRYEEDDEKRRMLQDMVDRIRTGGSDRKQTLLDTVSTENTTTRMKSCNKVDVDTELMIIASPEPKRKRKRPNGERKNTSTPLDQTTVTIGADDIDIIPEDGLTELLPTDTTENNDCKTESIEGGATKEKMQVSLSQTPTVPSLQNEPLSSTNWNKDDKEGKDQKINFVEVNSMQPSDNSATAASNTPMQEDEGHEETPDTNPPPTSTDENYVDDKKKDTYFSRFIRSPVVDVLKDIHGCFDVNIFATGGSQIIWKENTPFPFKPDQLTRLEVKAMKAAETALNDMMAVLGKTKKRRKLLVEGYSKAVYAYGRVFYVEIVGDLPRPCVLSKRVLRPPSSDAETLCQCLPEPLQQTYQMAFDFLLPKMTTITPNYDKSIKFDWLKWRVLMDAVYQNQLNINQALTGHFAGRSSEEMAAINRKKNKNRTKNKIKDL